MFHDIDRCRPNAMPLTRAGLGGVGGPPGGLFGATLGCSGCCWYDPPMSATAESVLQEALRLPEEDRADIAARLIASLDAESTESRGDVEEAWAAEIERRCEALDAGTTTTRSWEEVRRRIEADLLRK